MYVVFPTECLASASGLMVGTRRECGKILCVLNVVDPSLSEKIWKETGGSVLGYWYGYDSASVNRLAQGSHSKLVLQSRGRQIPEVYSEDDEVVLVLYDRQKSLSYFTTTPLGLRAAALELELTSVQGKTLPSLPLPRFNAESHTETILEEINNTKEMVSKFDAVLHPKRHSLTGRLLEFFNYILIVPNVVLSVLVYISSILLSFSKLGVFQWSVFSFLASLPVFLFQCSHRLSQLQFIGKSTDCQEKSLENADENVDCQRPVDPKPFEEQHKKQRIFIIKGNILTTIALDVFLGIIAVHLISSSTLIENIVDNLVQYTDYVAQLLTQLVNWLMGVPGGLKLNKTLTNFLGKFFLYHIYLWQTYLQVIQPYLQPVLWMCIMSGCLGMTFLISMASDVFSLLTLHIYFFYVYAARLYSLQIYAILSLSRLFTGRKWSVLRNRVDSLSYDVDRLFLGTLLFTVLLFLLPTTTLFYLVFTTLRLLVLVAKFFLSSLTHLLNKVPVFGLVLLVLRPSMLPGGLQLKIMEPSTDTKKIFSNPSPHLPPKVQALCIKLCNKPLSVMQLFDWSISTSDVTSAKQDTWGVFVRKLVHGQLVYPWIEKD